MKTILLCLLLIFSLSSVDWLTDFAKAKEQAIREKKVILLNFSGSDWCGPCIKMKKEIFETDKFQTFAGENLVLVRADFPRLKKNQLDKSLKQHNEMLAEKYNPQGKFPLTLLLDSHGTVLREWDGFNSSTTPDSFINAIKSACGR